MLKLQIQITFCLFISSLGVAKTRAQIEVPPQLQTRLEKIMQGTDLLQQALAAKNQPEANKQLVIINKSVRSALKKSSIAGKNEPHLILILEATKKVLEEVPYLEGEKRKDALKEVFRNLIQIDKIFKLKNEMKVFFCMKDKSSWLQSGKKAKNPFNPDTYPNCGSVVP